MFVCNLTNTSTLACCCSSVQPVCIGEMLARVFVYVLVFAYKRIETFDSLPACYFLSLWLCVLFFSASFSLYTRLEGGP